MIIQATEKHIPSIAKIHLESLRDDFLPSLGFNFLRTIYDGILLSSGVYTFIDIENNKVRGFVIGTQDSSQFFKDAIKAKFLVAAYYLFLEFIKKPIILKNILETFLYPQKDKGVKAELVVIAVSQKYQGKGIGKSLVKTLEQKFSDKKINKYKVTVHSDKDAIYFYERLGYNRVGKFYLYSKKWYIYEKILKKSKKS